MSPSIPLGLAFGIRCQAPSVHLVLCLQLILPYLDLKIEYYDLGLPNRDATDDKVTVEAAEAIQVCACYHAVLAHTALSPWEHGCLCPSQYSGAPNNGKVRRQKGLHAPLLKAGYLTLKLWYTATRQKHQA